MLNIFHNFIPHKIKKIDYKTPEWINRSIKLSLKKQSKLTKRYQSNPTANNKEVRDFQAKECASLTIESKERFIAKISVKLPMQNIWNKLEKSSKTGQDKKSLISTFACFLTATAKV